VEEKKRRKVFFGGEGKFTGKVASAPPGRASPIFKGNCGDLYGGSGLVVNLACDLRVTTKKQTKKNKKGRQTFGGKKSTPPKKILTMPMTFTNAMQPHEAENSSVF